MDVRVHGKNLQIGDRLRSQAEKKVSKAARFFDHVDRSRKAGKKDLNLTSQGADDDGAEGLEIVRVKQFVMKPMTPEDAALQMEQLGHNFYFFLNAETDKQSVLYRRRDGRLGLIEPA